jgi:hypothetical protein
MKRIPQGILRLSGVCELISLIFAEVVGTSDSLLAKQSELANTNRNNANKKTIIVFIFLPPTEEV